MTLAIFPNALFSALHHKARDCSAAIRPLLTGQNRLTPAGNGFPALRPRTLSALGFGGGLRLGNRYQQSVRSASPFPFQGLLPAPILPSLPAVKAGFHGFRIRRNGPLFCRKIGESNPSWSVTAQYLFSEPMPYPLGESSVLLAYGASEPLYSQKTVYGRPEGTLTLTLCVGERVAVPAACRSTIWITQHSYRKQLLCRWLGSNQLPSPLLVGRRSAC